MKRSNERIRFGEMRERSCVDVNGNDDIDDDVDLDLDVNAI